MIKISIQNQILSLYDDNGHLLKQYPVSTSKYGIGNRQGSYQTPLGRHRVCEKIGTDSPLDEVFIGREPKGLLSELQKQGAELPEDIITARILRLTGLEPELNQGGDVDSFHRYIYIHGTADEKNISTPASHGCIRMKNQDIAELYELIDVDSEVVIEA